MFDITIDDPAAGAPVGIVYPSNGAMHLDAWALVYFDDIRDFSYCPGYTGDKACPEVADLSSTPHSYLITSLTPGVEYYVRTAAMNTLGYGQIREATPGSMVPPKQPPSGPTNPYHEGGLPLLRVASGTSLVVHYGAPDFTGGDAITKYKIEWDYLSSFDSAGAYFLLALTLSPDRQGPSTLSPVLRQAWCTMFASLHTTPSEDMARRRLRHPQVKYHASCPPR